MAFETQYWLKARSTMNHAPTIDAIFPSQCPVLHASVNKAHLLGCFTVLIDPLPTSAVWWHCT